MFFVALYRHRLEVLVVAALDPKLCRLADRRRDASCRVQAAFQVVLSINQPCFCIGFIWKQLGAALAASVDIGNFPANQTGGQGALADVGHDYSSPMRANSKSRSINV